MGGWIATLLRILESRQADAIRRPFDHHALLVIVASGVLARGEFCIVDKRYKHTRYYRLLVKRKGHYRFFSTSYVGNPFPLVNGQLTVASSAIPGETGSALARVATLLIDALRVGGAHVLSRCTLVHVDADRASVFLVQILITDTIKKIRYFFENRILTNNKF